ncbi:MAG: 50S ribosomal protein L13 [Pseudobdellovibrio sp.]|uniref:50S ribosomal protein L13 n=1 Tax=Pseudobdellovibrio sp. HCB154 TaxID=3386277 RepID=UPI0039170DDF|nr:50S ribosomal protein L13 [Pseudobdellovibrio sp.]
MKTWNAKTEETDRQWFIVDASGLRLGRLATHVANILRGKNLPTFTPNQDAGGFVVVINSDKIEMTGNKWNTKKYYRHSRFFGSLKEKSAEIMRQDNSQFIIEDAVKGMLPVNKLSKTLITKLKVYPGAEHPHAAQKPQAYTVKVKNK